LIVVSDTGPLAYLVEIGLAEYLPTMYGEVLIPPTVAVELSHEACPAAPWFNERPAWLRIVAPQVIPGELKLDRGEQEAIALALEVGAERILMDELRGRAVATALGLRVAGTLAVILDCADKGLCNGREALARLEKTNFYVSADLLQSIREKLGQQ